MYFRITIDSLFYVFLRKEKSEQKKNKMKEYKTKENKRTNVQTIWIMIKTKTDFSTIKINNGSQKLKIYIF